MEKGEKMSDQFFAQPLPSFNVIDEEKRRCKYSDEEVEKLRQWMVDNPYTRDCPFGTVRRRDMYGVYFCLFQKVLFCYLHLVHSCFSECK